MDSKQAYNGQNIRSLVIALQTFEPGEISLTQDARDLLFRFGVDAVRRGAEEGSSNLSAEEHGAVADRLIAYRDEEGYSHPLVAMTLAGSVSLFVIRHVSKEWGDLCDDDKQANEDALRTGARLVSRYQVMPDESIYVITASTDDESRPAHRSLTTILRVEEY